MEILKHNYMPKTQIQIEFDSEVALRNFVKWFKKDGFDLFTKSKFNPLTKTTDDFITCLATDEKTDWGYYLELQ